jgi:hypothetical protein
VRCKRGKQGKAQREKNKQNIDPGGFWFRCPAPTSHSQAFKNSSSMQEIEQSTMILFVSWKNEKKTRVVSSEQEKRSTKKATKQTELWKNFY